MEVESCKACGLPLRAESQFCVRCGVAKNGLIYFPSEASKPDHEHLVRENWKSFKGVLTLYGLFLFASLVLGFANYLTKNPITTVIYWFVMLMVSFFYIYQYRESALASFQLPKISFYRLAELCLLALVTYVLVDGYFSLFSIFKMPISRSSTEYIKFGWPVWSIYFLISLCPGIIEEIVFRGIIQTKLEEVLGWKEALIIQAACFSILHLMPTIFISHFIMGLFAGWIRMRTSSVWPCMIVHIAWNAHVLFKELG